MSNIQKMDVTKALPEFYLPYAQYVDQTRALPDARDCLKTGTRFILYAQYLAKLTYDKKARKGVATKSAAMEFSVHGDASIFGTAVRLSQPFSMRYPLVEVVGNNGSQLYGSSVFSADRYLEMRSSKLASEMTALLDKNTIDNWEWNYTREKQYPVVLPSLFPNFVNGCTGIGVGMATSIPQFNLREVCASAIKLLNNPNLSFDDIYCPVDFCTGGIIINENEVKESLKTGNGKAAIIRAVINYDANNRELIATQIPYQTTSSNIVQQIQTCIESGLLSGVESVFDGSDIEGVKICIKLAKGATPERVLKTLYKETSLQSHYGINMMMLENGKYPKLFSFKDMILSYLNHMQEVLRKSFEFDLNKYQTRAEILNGLIKAIDILDEVLVSIRTSKNKEEAHNKLIEMGFTSIQVDAILTMQLQRLVNLEIIKLQKEHDEILSKIEKLNLLLTNPDLFRDRVIEEIKRISNEYSDDRKSICYNLEKTKEEEIIEEKNLIVYFTNYGNLYIEESNTLIAQSKGGKGSKIKLGKGEIVLKTISGKSKGEIILFTNLGRAYKVELDDLFSSNNIYELIGLSDNEKILEITTTKSSKYILFITKQGILKKSELSLYNITKRGVGALKLNEEDELVRVLLLNEEKIGLLTSNGIFKIIETNTINPIGRIAIGVIGIKLDESDYLVDAKILEKNTTGIISISKEGYGTKVSIDEFPTQGRATKGKILQKGNMCGFAFISDTDKEIMACSSKNIIKVPLSSITYYNRGAQGTKILSLNSDNIIGVLK